MSKLAVLTVGIVGLLEIGMRDSCGDSKPSSHIEERLFPLQGSVIGSSYAERDCAENSLLGFDLVSPIQGRYKTIAVCLPAQEYRFVPNWNPFVGEYDLAVAPIKDSNDGQRFISAFGSEGLPLYKLLGIQARNMPYTIKGESELMLYDPSGGSLCPQGEKLYGLMLRDREGLRFLVCGEGVDANSADSAIFVQAEATSHHDRVGRPIYRALERLQEL